MQTLMKYISLALMNVKKSGGVIFVPLYDFFAKFAPKS